MFIPLQKSKAVARRSGEGGWALLGLLLALTIMGIVMATAIAPNVPVQVQRSKEEDMIYRGEQMAVGIARYYNPNADVRRTGFQIYNPPPYGFLTDLKKLRDGITIQVREYKFIRPSDMINPMTSQEWEPVRARDPRILKVLQAWVVETQQPGIPQAYSYMAMARQPLQRANPSDGADGTQPPPPGTQPPNGRSRLPRGQDPNDPNGDPNDASDHDPLADLLGSSGEGGASSNAPIVGVAPKIKGTALRSLYGLDKYEDWVFICIPNNPLRPGTSLR